MTPIRIDFNDLFDFNSKKELILKRIIIINGKVYQIGDALADNSINFPYENPNDYFYIVSIRNNTNLLVGWSIK